MKTTFSPPNLPNLELPLMSLKGNPYMKVAYRLQWFVTDVKRYSISTEYPVLTDAKATVRVTVNIFDDTGNLVKSAQASKTETQKDFNDYVEKAETGALGRALASLGYGTAQAVADLDEGTRIVDAPLAEKNIPSPEAIVKGAIAAANATVASITPAAKNTWRAPKPKTTTVETTVTTTPSVPKAKTANGDDDGWG